MAFVPVVAAEVGIAVGGLHFENAVANFEHRNIEGAAAQDRICDLFVGFLVETVGQRCCRRLIDDAQHFEAGDFTRVLGGGALRVVEIGGHGDDRLGDFLAETWIPHPP